MMQYAPFFYKEKFMAKRFYDSNKYDDSWFRNLTPDLKCVFDYCLCKCDHAGILELDIESVNWHTNGKNTLKEIQENFATKFMFLSDNKIFIPNFLYWQYKNELNPSNGVHRCVYDLLVLEGIRVEPYLASHVLKTDFEEWVSLCKQLKEKGMKYTDLLKQRKEEK